MAENSKIEWTDHTFNPWIGCTKVGPPCDNCYAEALSNRYGWVTWGAHGNRKRTSPANWKKPYQWDRAAEKANVRARVFSASLADWLDNQVPQEWRGDLGNVIDQTLYLDWLLLTKRIQNFKRLSPWQRPPRNVWLGITCGSQPELDRDWPMLAAIDVAVRFISYEPALGPLVLGDARPGPATAIIIGSSAGAKAGRTHVTCQRNGPKRCAMSAPPRASHSS